MPTVLQPKALAAAAQSPVSAVPFIVVALLSLLFAASIWAAGTAKPPIEATTAALQGGL